MKWRDQETEWYEDSFQVGMVFCESCEEMKPKKEMIWDLDEDREVCRECWEDCPHEWRFVISQYQNMKWWNYFKCKLCGKTKKIYHNNFRLDK